MIALKTTQYIMLTYMNLCILQFFLFGWKANKLFWSYSKLIAHLIEFKSNESDIEHKTVVFHNVSVLVT